MVDKAIEWFLRLFILGLCSVGGVRLGHAAGLEGNYVLVASVPIVALAGVFLAALETR